MATNVAKARASGLRFRPLAETIADTLAWDRDRPEGEMKAGLRPERERELLDRWHARTDPPGGTAGAEA
jgi:2'-hydroxyisoflavone reductase